MKRVVSAPTINANDDAVVIVRWHVEDGAPVEAGAPLVDVETTKAVAVVQADHSGWVRRRCREGDEVAVGGELAWIFSAQDELTPEGEGQGATVASVPKVTSEPVATTKAEPVPVAAMPAPSGVVPEAFAVTKFSAAAEKLATDRGVGHDAFANTNLGLVTSAMLQKLLDQGHAPATASPTVTADPAVMRCERIPAAKRAEIYALRQGAGEHLTSALTICFDSVDIRSHAEKSGHGLLPLLLGEVAKLLRENPKFTAFADGESIGFYDAVHLGVAIDLGEGLKVVVIRDADRLDAAGIGEQLAQLTLDYMEKKLGVEAVQGATFTVTDISGLDILYVEPLINGRQSAILAIGADSAQEGYPMTLTVAFDHRVLNGREVGEFLQKLRRKIFAGVAPSAPGPAVQARDSDLPCCDMCMTDIETYYKELGAHRHAVMLQYVRPDGSVGLICHRCQGGFT